MMAGVTGNIVALLFAALVARRRTVAQWAPTPVCHGEKVVSPIVVGTTSYTLEVTRAS
jgi:hypothetical protein